jgi:hypothetical protein
MMIDKHAVQALSGSRLLQTRLDRAYNEQSFADDRTPPYYRHFVVAASRPDDPVLDWASRRLGAMSLADILARPPVARETADAMFAALEVHARNQEIQVRLEPERRDAHVADVERHRQQAFEVLAHVQAENARLSALLQSVERSHTFRLASWARRLLRRHP